MKRNTVTAPIRVLSQVWVSYPGSEPNVVGTFTPRIDYPGGIEAYAGMVWDSVCGNTSRDETRWIERVSKVEL